MRFGVGFLTARNCQMLPAFFGPPFFGCSQGEYRERGCQHPITCADWLSPHRASLSVTSQSESARLGRACLGERRRRKERAWPWPRLPTLNIFAAKYAQKALPKQSPAALFFSTTPGHLISFDDHRDLHCILQKYDERFTCRKRLFLDSSPFLGREARQRVFC